MTRERFIDAFISGYMQKVAAVTKLSLSPELLARLQNIFMTAKSKQAFGKAVMEDKELYAAILDIGNKGGVKAVGDILDGARAAARKAILDQQAYGPRVAPAPARSAGDLVPVPGFRGRPTVMDIHGLSAEDLAAAERAFAGSELPVTSRAGAAAAVPGADATAVPGAGIVPTRAVDSQLPARVPDGSVSPRPEDVALARRIGIGDDSAPGPAPGPIPPIPPGMHIDWEELAKLGLLSSAGLAAANYFMSGAREGLGEPPGSKGGPQAGQTAPGQVAPIDTDSGVAVLDNVPDILGGIRDPEPPQTPPKGYEPSTNTPLIPLDDRRLAGGVGMGYLNDVGITSDQAEAMHRYYNQNRNGRFRAIYPTFGDFYNKANSLPADQRNEGFRRMGMNTGIYTTGPDGELRAWRHGTPTNS